MITGQELYELLQSVAPTMWWIAWEQASPQYRQAFDTVAGILNERSKEREYEALAGEDI